MLIRTALRRPAQTLLVCLCITIFLAGCDRRKYSTSVYNSPGDGDNPNGETLSDPIDGSGGTAVATTGDVAGGSAGDTAGTGDDVEAGDTNSDVGDGATPGEPTADTAGVAAGDTIADESADREVSNAVDATDAPISEATGDITDSAPVVDPSEALAGTVTDPEATLQPGTIEPAAVEVVDPADVDGANGTDGAVEQEPLLPGELPGQVPAAVPQGPDVDRIGAGSIYQPSADVETATYTIDGRRSQALAAVGGPVLQSPRALMEEIDEYHLNDANQVAFTGRFSIAREPAYGVWAGDASAPNQIFQTGTSIPGLADEHTYFKTLKLALGDDGSLAQLVEVQAEATMTQAYMVSRGNTHNVVMQSASTIAGLIGPVRIDAIEVADQSDNVSALVSVERIVTKVPVEERAGVLNDDIEDDEAPEQIELVTRQYSVWYVDNGQTRAIAHSWIDKPQSAPRLGNGCRVYAPDNTVDNLRLGVTRNASLIFQAQVGGDGNCEQGRAVMRYSGSGYQEVVKDGDAVPGSGTHVFSDVSLYTVTEDGSAVVFANLASRDDLAEALEAEQVEPDEDAIRLAELIGVPVEQEETFDGQWSFWLMPPQGGARLIALEGEEIQVGRSIAVFSGESRSLSLQINANNQISLKVLLEETEQPVYFVGLGHAGQPHGSIDVPGASALQYAFTSNSALPGQGTDAVLGKLGTPYVDMQGNLVIYGEVSPSEQAIEAAADQQAQLPGTASNPVTEPLVKPFNSLWQVDPAGTMRELVRSGDAVAIAGVKKPIASLSVAGQIARPGTSGVRVNSSGALLLRATIERKFGNPVLLYIAP
ncbi:MAG: hypothetical protein AB8B87_21725 [Granulosicoccus sp.]